MSKELFNQDLIESPDSPDSDLRIAFGKPGVAGGLNMVWTYFKQLLQSAVDWIDFTPQDPVPDYLIGRIFYDATENTWSAYNDIEGISLQLGEELRARLVNDTGGDLLDGKAVSVIGAIGASLQVELMDASEFDSAIRGFGLMTNTTVNGQPGYAVRYGAVNDINTAGLTVGQIVYGDPENPGELTTTRPTAPYYPIRIGVCLNSDAVNGVIGVDNLAFNGSDTSVNAEGLINGIITQTQNVNISVSGGVIYADVTNEDEPTKNLRFLLGGIRYDLDTTTNTGPGGSARIIIPPGASSTAKQGSFVYIYLNGGVPTLATSSTEPSIPYATVCQLTVFDAARTLADGKPFGYRRYNNAINNLDGSTNGALGLITEILTAIRIKLGSNWLFGQDATPTVNDTTIRVAMSAGRGAQFRRGSVPAFDGLNYLIYNTIANVITYADSTNLTDITQDATGGTLLANGRYYTIRLFYILNSNGVGNNVIATRPLGSYTSPENAQSDPLNYAVGFNDTDVAEIVYPLYDIIIGRTGASGVTISLIELRDKRTRLATGGGGGGATGVTTDDKVRVSAADNINDYLTSKISVTGALKTIVDPAGNEVLDFKVNTLYTPDGAAGVVLTTNAGFAGVGAIPVCMSQVTGDSVTVNTNVDVMHMLTNTKYSSVDTAGRNKLVFGWDDHYAAGIAGNKVGTNATGLVFIVENGFNTELDAVFISSTGRMGIGTSSPQAHLDVNTETAETTKLRINGETTQQKRLEIRHYDASEAGLDNNMGFIATKAANSMVLGNVNASGVDQDALTINENLTVVGASTFTGTDFILSSDRRKKSDIKYQVPSIDGLQPTSHIINGALQYGFIAQDMLETHKELVIGTGEEIDGEIDYYSIKQNSIIAMLVQEVQELKKRLK